MCTWLRGIGEWLGFNYVAATVIETPVSLWHASGTVDSDTRCPFRAFKAIPMLPYDKGPLVRNQNSVSVLSSNVLLLRFKRH